MKTVRPTRSKGSSGAVGSAAVQLARHLGANPIESSRAPREGALNLGAEDPSTELKRLTSARGIKVVVDCVGDAGLFPKFLKCLAKNGR